MKRQISVILIGFVKKIAVSDIGHGDLFVCTDFCDCKEQQKNSHFCAVCVVWNFLCYTETGE